MKDNFAYEYEIHKRRELTTLVCMTVALICLEFALFFIFCTSLMNLVCENFLQETDMTYDELMEYDGFQMCSMMVPSLACYYVVTPIYCAAYILPPLTFALTSRPHDCFHCLSVDPDLRISNYQLTRLEIQKRMSPYGSERSSGGAFSGFMVEFKKPSLMNEERRYALWRDSNECSTNNNDTSSNRHRSHTYSAGSELIFDRSLSV